MADNKKGLPFATTDNVFTKMMREARARGLQEIVKDDERPRNTTARDNVFGITELAEKIFLECRIRDLLVNCQRVSKQGNGFIASSHRLQQALFFEPLPGYDVCHFSEDVRGGDEKLKHTAYFADRHQSDRNPDYYERGPVEDEVTEDQIARWTRNERTLTYFAPRAYTTEAISDYQKRREKISSAKPSWWRMFASQPPLLEVCYNRTDNMEDAEDWRYDGDGIKILDTMSKGKEHEMNPIGLEHMTPVTYAKDVRRTNYIKGEYELEECRLDLW